MKKKLFSIFIGLTFMSGAVIAEEPDKPFFIKNTLDCSLSGTLNGTITDINPNEEIRLNANQFPFTTSGYCPSNNNPFGYSISPKNGESKKHSSGCYEIKDAGKTDNGEPLFKIEEVSCPMQPLTLPSAAP